TSYRYTHTSCGSHLYYRVKAVNETFFSPYSDEATVALPATTTPVIESSGNLTFCEGVSLRLIAPEGFAEYLWSNGETSREITVSVAGTYEVVVKKYSYCPAVASAAVQVEPVAPEAEIMEQEGELIA